jgi:hypothetical protein
MVRNTLEEVIHITSHFNFLCLPYQTITFLLNLEISHSLFIFVRPRVFFKYRINYTYLLTPWNRVLLEKLTGSAASQEIPRTFVTRSFLIVLTRVRHVSLTWANSIQSPQPPPTSWRSTLILASHLRLGHPNGLFPSGFPTRTLCTPLV